MSRQSGESPAGERQNETRLILNAKWAQIIVNELRGERKSKLHYYTPITAAGVVKTSGLLVIRLPRSSPWIDSR